MKLVSLVVGFAAVAGSAFASTAKATRAWTISSANASAPEEVLGKHREFVKVWTITGSTPVGALQFAAAGPVFVDYDATLASAPTPSPTTATPTVAPTEAPATPAPTTVAPVAGSFDGSQAPMDGAISLAAAAEGDDAAAVVAKVVFSGNCTALLDEVEVVEHDGALKVLFKYGDFRGFGYLLTEVVVATKAAVAKLSTSGSSSVYVSEGVVVAGNQSAASIAIGGDGDVLVTAPSTDFSLRALDLKVSGSGDIQFQAASLAVNGTLWSKISGDATIAVVAKSVDAAQAIESKISGDGAVYVQADNVRTATIDSKISGDGAITISTNGSCVSQEIHISGEGNVAAGSILCENTTLRMSGEGNVLVQTSGTFRVPHEIDGGKVQYVGAAPQLITDGRKPRPPHSKHPKHHGWYFGWWDDEGSDDEDDEESPHFLPKSVTAAPENAYTTYALKDAPAREPAFLVLTITRSFWGSDPSEHGVASIIGWDIGISGSGEHSFSTATQRLAARVHEQHGPTGTAALGVGAVAAVVAVGVAAHKLAAPRRRRREYTPLLSVVTN